MFRVKCKLVTFAGHEEKYPCHFGYKIGDEFYYDGVEFKGRICPGLLASMMPVIHGTFLLGYKYNENVMFRYRGLDVKDPDMARYDGVGYRPTDEVPGGVPEKLKRTGPPPKIGEKARVGHFTCGDTRILADFSCEAVDLSDSDYAQPFYRRAISVLEKIEKNPGVTVSDILEKFTDFEKNEISPRLTPVLLEVLMDALTDMDYVEIRNSQAYATGKEPPSRPKIG
jgi:uncharacterized repeat protein (TIGR04076 family)